MSDRGNVLFYNEEDKSVVISSYWGSIGFVYVAIQYAIELKKYVDHRLEDKPNISGPIERLQPEVVAADFMRVLYEQGWTERGKRDSGLYLYRDEKEVEDVFQIDLNNPSEHLSNKRIRRFFGEDPDEEKSWRGRMETLKPDRRTENLIKQEAYAEKLATYMGQFLQRHPGIECVTVQDSIYFERKEDADLFTREFEEYCKEVLE